MVVLILFLVALGTFFGLRSLALRGHAFITMCVMIVLFIVLEAYIRMTCSGDCNIRIDLLITAPIVLMSILMWFVYPKSRNKKS